VVQNNVDVFPDVRGERIATVVPGQVSHSVIGFSEPRHGHVARLSTKENDIKPTSQIHATQN
jgi:hypothetical protein